MCRGAAAAQKGRWGRGSPARASQPPTVVWGPLAGGAVQGGPFLTPGTGTSSLAPHLAASHHHCSPRSEQGPAPQKPASQHAPDEPPTILRATIRQQPALQGCEVCWPCKNCDCNHQARVSDMSSVPPCSRLQATVSTVRRQQIAVIAALGEASRKTFTNQVGTAQHECRAALCQLSDPEDCCRRRMLVEVDQQLHPCAGSSPPRCQLLPPALAAAPSCQGASRNSSASGRRRAQAASLCAAPSSICNMWKKTGCCCRRCSCC